ncbi:MAG TPA: type II toxin-antitoxin system CcdA family antitoxin [Azospirillaceae bacterium]|nr:type II toxin-antitoxin system CcdA family antitoxin [Azospirillaceae bacterium]
MARGAAQRRPTNVSARPELVAEAKALGINLSQVFEAAVEEAVKLARRQRWVEENRPAFDAYDAYVEKHGVFSDGKRMF